MELAIDSSTEIAGLALACKGEVKTELAWYCGRNQSVELMPNLVRMLDRFGMTANSIDAVIVAKGPGSFNGLRVGMSIAKGFAYSLGVPIIGVSTLEVEAYPFMALGLPICPIHSAGRGEIATAIYQAKKGVWQRLVEEHISTVAEVCSQVKVKTLFCGELSSEIETELIEQLGDKAIIPRSVVRLRRAGYLAELGWKELEKGQVDDPATLQPVYLRQPPITKPKPRASTKRG